jgi:hypothetical protein
MSIGVSQLTIKPTATGRSRRSQIFLSLFIYLASSTTSITRKQETRKACLLLVVAHALVICSLFYPLLLDVLA